MIARRILDINMDIVAVHLHHDVHVDLKLSRNTSLDFEVVRLCATPPATEFAPDEDK
jgi:hypothetical protein